MAQQAEENLRKRIASWKDAYTDTNTGICSNVEGLLWDYAAFGTAMRIVFLNNQRLRAEGTDKKRKPANPLLFDLLARGYWSGLLLGTRRLVDPGPLAGDKGVNSLRALLKDVSAARSNLTRKIYVEHLRNCSYDLDELRSKNKARLELAKGKAIWGDPGLSRSEYAHRDFDLLACVEEGERSENDLVEPSIFKAFEDRIAALDRISDHVSSHLAHAGNDQSRRSRDLVGFDIRDARDVLQTLTEIAGLAGRLFADEGPPTLAVALFDQFEELGRAPVDEAEISDLETAWANKAREIETWHLSPDDFVTSFSNR